MKLYDDNMTRDAMAMADMRHIDSIHKYCVRSFLELRAERCRDDRDGDDR